MLIDLSDVLSKEGMVQDFEVNSDLKEFTFGGNVYTVDTVKDFVLHAKNAGKRKAAISGECEIVLSMQCDRCLDEVKKNFNVQIDEVIDMAVFETDKMDEINELNYLEDCIVNMDTLLEKELMTMIPVQVLCKEDCKGLCRVCGTNLNHATCDCDDFVPDPRLSVFANILKD